MPADTEILLDGPEKAPWTIALAHGAGAGMRHRFMSAFAAGLGERGFRVARFEFPYMAAFSRDGKKHPPDREPKLRQAWHDVIEELGRDRLIIGGKSMGGRIASLVADEEKVRGLVCLGYPFHPVGQPERLRVEHLRTLTTPTIIVQGTRDSFGTRDEVAGYTLSKAIQVHWLEDGDHSFTPRKSSGRTEAQNWDEALDTIAAWTRTLPK